MNTIDNYSVLSESESSSSEDEEADIIRCCGNGGVDVTAAAVAAADGIPAATTPHNRESHVEVAQGSQGCFARLIRSFKQNWRLFVVKPVLVIYGLQWAITGSITTQLWLERTCSVIFGYNETVCSNLTNPEWEDIETQVQKQVTDYQIVDQYLAAGAPLLISLYLGPVSDRGRKLLMYVPFSGHIVSGIVPLVFLYYKHWPPQVLWLINIYTLGGGYSVLQIAMYGYIGDVTNQKNRTVFMAILAGLTILVFPAAEAIGGQLYNYFGYFTVYGVSLAFTFVGLVYIYFVPESVTDRIPGVLNEGDDDSSNGQQLSVFGKVAKIISDGNQTLLSSAKCMIKPRTGSRRRIVMSLVGISVISSLEFSATRGVGLLFAEKKFGWNVVDYTNFQSFAFTMYGLRTFISTPFLCYFLGIHDCMLAISGGLATMQAHVTFGLATKGWMLYYAVGLTMLGGIEGTPLKSLLSKCVGLDEFGKIFTASSAASSLASLAGAAIVPKLYQSTVDYLPGAVYFFMASLQLVCVICMSFLFWVIIRHEKVHGVIGSEQDEFKRMRSESTSASSPSSAAAVKPVPVE